MTNISTTPAKTLKRARKIAQSAGLLYVYTGNIHDHEGDTTYCPSCGEALIERNWYEIEQYHVTPDGHCPDCASSIAGRFEKFSGQFGRRRTLISVGGVT